MNWLFVTVMIIFIAGLIIGLFRGGVRIAVSLAATILTFVLVAILSPYVSKAIYSLTPLDDMIHEKCVSTMSSLVTSSSLSEMGMDEESVKEILDSYGISEKALESAGITIDDILNGNVSSDQLEQYGIPGELLNGGTPTSEEDAADALESAEIPRQVQMTAIQNADLPQIFKSLLRDNNNSEVYSSLGVDSFVDYVSAYITKLVIGIVAFLATFILLTIVLRAVIFTLDIVTQLPVLGTVNRIAGGVIGIVIALIVVDVMFVIITLMYTTGVGQYLFAMINSNDFLAFLYDNNLVMQLATAFR